MSSFVEINGFNCRYEYNTNIHARETIVFINGIASPLESWNIVKAPFEDRYNTLVYDMRGQWSSETTDDKPYSFLGMADDLLQLTEKLGIENAHIVGTSLGGEIALWFALLYPQKAKSLSVLASVSEADELMCLRVDRWRRVASEALEALDISNDCPKVFQKAADNFHDVFVPDIFSNNFLSKEYQSLEQRKLGVRENIHRGVYKGHINLTLMFYKLKAEEKLTPRLHEIHCPTLVVGAEFDAVKPASFSELIASKIPNAKLHILKDTGHAVLLERPAEIVALLNGFISANKKVNQVMYDHVNIYCEDKNNFN
ncbi:MAG: alpha/beta hydrolase [Gammaproteobacteria bacterium]|nr:MAG: alpha/beta hydrolase [Gammaproteobacteria bacterium]